MKKYFYFFTYFIITIIISQTISGQETINQFNSNGKRVGTWKKYFKNGNIRYQGQFKKGTEVGIFKFYSPTSSEHPIVIKTFSKFNNAAIVQFFTENGILESEGEMREKNRIGKWLYYHTDGKVVISEENYVDGVLNGMVKTFYKSGKVTEILFYKEGKLHGNIKRFASNGVLLDDLTYENGELHGAAKYYNVEGKLLYWGDYENDEKVGEWQYSGKRKL